MTRRVERWLFRTGEVNGEFKPELAEERAQTACLEFEKCGAAPLTTSVNERRAVRRISALRATEMDLGQAATPPKSRQKAIKRDARRWRGRCWERRRGTGGATRRGRGPRCCGDGGRPAKKDARGRRWLERRRRRRGRWHAYLTLNDIFFTIFLIKTVLYLGGTLRATQCCPCYMIVLHANV